MIAGGGIGNPTACGQRHHGIPVGEAPDGCGFRERRDKAEHRSTCSRLLAVMNTARVARQHQRGQRH